MDAFVNKLDEVVISNKKLKPKIANSQSIVDKQYFDDNLLLNRLLSDNLLDRFFNLL